MFDGRKTTVGICLSNFLEYIRHRTSVYLFIHPDAKYAS